MKKCSIITVCYNNLEGLKKTFESVICQKWKDYEFIVVDGGSNDGSAGFIADNAGHFSWWVSEKDKGIYNAMNKGIARAGGEYCLFFNSGDYLSDPGALERIFSKGFDEDIIYADIIRTRGRKKKIMRYPDRLTLQDFYRRSAVIHHQASFIKRELFDKFGLYREDLYLNADWQFFFKTIALGKVSTRHIHSVISICDAYGRSSDYDLSDPRLAKDEAEKIKSLELAKGGEANLRKADVSSEGSRLGNILRQLEWNVSVLLPLSFFIKTGK